MGRSGKGNRVKIVRMIGERKGRGVKVEEKRKGKRKEGTETEGVHRWKERPLPFISL